jgi:hypothetical protein
LVIAFLSPLLGLNLPLLLSEQKQERSDNLKKVQSAPFGPQPKGQGQAKVTTLHYHDHYSVGFNLRNMTTTALLL